MMKYPIGIQSFAQLREDGFVYVDKTQLLYRLVTEGKIYFLSRPRRFGKSLLVSTLKAYFQGRKDLFQGLALEELEKQTILQALKNYGGNLSHVASSLGISRAALYRRLEKHGISIDK